MQFEICFLDRRGRLSCLMSGQFSDRDHAARFARHAMDAAAARGKLASAEVHGEGPRLVVRASPHAQPKRSPPAAIPVRTFAPWPSQAPAPA